MAVDQLLLSGVFISLGVFAILITLEAFAVVDVKAYIVQGPLHNALVDTMEQESHLRKITLTAPQKIMKKGAYRWAVTGELLSEYGVGTGFLSVTTQDCAKHTKASWGKTFPCVITKQHLQTTCSRPLPEGIENATWTTSMIYIPSSRWDGVVPVEPAMPSAQGVPFDNMLNCRSLGGLLLAKLIQENGFYKGEGTVNCEQAANFTYIAIEAHDGFDGYLHMTANNKLEADVIESKNISWTSGFSAANELIVTTVTRGVTGDQSTLKYNKELLTHEKLIVDGKVHSYQYSNARPRRGEPRLCSVTSMSSVCTIMAGLSTSSLNALGNLTGFNLESWGSHNGSVSVSGFVLGREGVISGHYTAPVLNSNDPPWMELPLRSRSLCKPRVYAFSNCSNVHGLADKVPTLGHFQRDEELRLFV